VRFRSVLGRAPAVTFETALFDGLAPDGSLYVPESLPALPPGALDPRATRDLPSLAARALAPFLDTFTSAELADLTARALSFPVPLVHLEGRIHLLELFHGPTLAFKDVGARFMAGAMSRLLEREGREVTVLVATSGDTGSAVAQGFAGAARVRVFVLYPAGRVSDLQEAQITTVGGHVHALEVAGSFDDCQRLVKGALAADAGGAGRAGHTLTTANSINLGRLLPQLTYALWGGVQLRASLGDDTPAPTVVVPSGNLGNLTAAAYARAMGSPTRRLVAATNANDVVPEYLSSGRYAPRPSVVTHSNAMDVGDPSNLPRLEHLFGHDLDALRSVVRGEAVSDAETLAEIRRTHDRTGVTLDPHTAVGVAAARRLDGEEPVIVMATAHPAKFPDVMRAALGHAVEPPPALAAALARPRERTRIAADPEALRAALAAR
jgi:threonine synthase